MIHISFSYLFILFRQLVFLSSSVVILFVPVLYLLNCLASTELRKHSSEWDLRLVPLFQFHFAINNLQSICHLIVFNSSFSLRFYLVLRWPSSAVLSFWRSPSHKFSKYFTSACIWGLYWSELLTDSSSCQFSCHLLVSVSLIWTCLSWMLVCW